MNYPAYLPKAILATVLVVTFSLVVIIVVPQGHAPSSATSFTCSGVHVYPGNDLDAIVNSDPSDSATTFCLHASSSGTTYWVNNSVLLRAGDKLLGQPGPVITRGPASYGVPPVKIRNGASLRALIYANGPNVELRWLDVAGGVTKYKSDGSMYADSGHGVTAGMTDATARMEYLTVHDNQSTGINSMNGKLFHSNLYNNGTNPDSWGWSAAAVKGVDEYEAAHNYVHDNPANGLWCDHQCSDFGAAMPNGFWAHDNLLVNNGRWGVRYEYSPIVAGGVHIAQPTAMIERNEIHGNGYNGGYGGASMADAQNAIYRNNFFGPKTVAGVSYRANSNGRAIQFIETGRSDRTDLWNGDAIGNSLGGEAIVGCEKPDSVVYCANNR